ncbi:NADH-quinone oxidoreductase subunit M [Dactylosporangium aurantiacum]|uniref:NADH-quinone oxidoreductase subunit M n=1 Tax=Dactylosporangium aurantiacum TaxID=35754 RepID=A0A9Q9IN65_9ACTN|nr:NADH-quinone oxidoreductase subunit M [Dactylosporangium aurantiacum]MDG6110304.1 NADH-quinone oxidoreductase subunit M [Dactylosporangium aurantiacum]UWZ58576.1 NADH-quinone oxidoreductase subunit M [Dactylosporangium aurantiacum]
MLSLLVFAPAAAALVVLLWRSMPAAAVRWIWVAVSAAELAGIVALWAGYDGGIGYEVNRPWIPGAGSAYHLGVDGLSLPLLTLTAVIFCACAVYSLRHADRIRGFAALFLALETTCLGLFAALDLIVFFVFFDLSIVGMYAVIAGWGHGAQAARSALKFFLYTFVGSLALLVGFIGLFVAARPHTFDMVTLTAQNPLAGHGGTGGLVLLALGIGLAVKTPTFPFHTWLPPAHTDAPAAGSAVLAGVLLKMGTYGFVRIAMPMLPDAWRRYALIAVVVGVTSALYGALVALAQTNFKRMIAYTSVNHMGYILLAVGAAGLVAGTDTQARTVAVTGAVTQMVSHGLITGALFLLAGVLFDRGGTYEMGAYGGLAADTPRFAALTAVAAFASLGLPAFSGFIAEFQIFTGSFGSAPFGAGLALLGILLTAALFLWALHRLFLGPSRHALSAVADVRGTEAAAIAPLLALSLAVGVFPRPLLDLIEPAARSVADLVAR